MKKFYKLFVALTVMAIGAVMPARAQVVEDEIDGINYELDKSGLTASVIALAGGEKYTGDVEIPEKVEYKGDYYDVERIEKQAFLDCDELTSVTIPSSVYYIGESAFLRCYLLTSIEIPSSVKVMDKDVFYSCTGLESVTFEADIASLPQGTFYECTSLTSFVVPEGVMEIQREAFSNCSSLETIELPSSLYLIGDGAFVLCSSLSSIELPSALSTLGDNAFYFCTSLSTITIPAALTTIGEAVFENCSSLTSIEVEEANANYCSKDGVLYSKDETTLVAVPGGKEGVFAIPEGVTTVGKSAMSFCEKITHLSIPQSVATIEEYAFYGCENIKTVVCMAVTPPVVTGSNAFVYIDRDETLLLVPTGSESSYTSDAHWSWFKRTDNTIPDILIDGINYELYIISSGRAIVKGLPGTDKYEGDIVIPDYVQFCGAKFMVVEIDGFAFENSDVTSVQLPEYIETIGGMAFKGCSHLTNIDLKYISSLGMGAFLDCSSLKAVEIPGSIPDLPASAFKGCISLEGVVIPDIASIDAEAFSGCINLKMIICRASKVLPLMGGDVFKDVDPDIPVFIPFTNPADYEADPQWSSYFHNFIGNYFSQIVDGVNYHFNTASNYADVFPLPDAAKYKGDIVIPAEVEVFGLDFEVLSISSEAFKDCPDLTSVSMPEGLGYIHDGAFQGCTGLTELNIPASVIFVDGYQFEGCTNLRSVSLPLSMSFIPDHMFEGCASLDSLIIPDPVTNIGDKAFAGCTGMTYLYCLPVFPPAWSTDNCFEDVVPANVTVRVPDVSLASYSNDPNDPGWQYFFHFIGSTVDLMVNGINYTVNLEDYTASVRPLPGLDKYQENVIVPDHVPYRDKDYPVTSISTGAFMDCVDLDTIVLPATIMNIGDEAFKGSGLTLCVCLASTPPTVGVDAFYNVLGAMLWVPDHTAYAASDWASFYIVGYLAQVIDGVNYELQLPDYRAVVETLTGGARYTGEIVIPASVSFLGLTFDVTEIDAYAFSYTGGNSDDMLTSVTMPEGLQYIGDYAFDGCHWINSIIIPSTVKSIGEVTFGYTSITEITIPAAVASIDPRAFCRCESLDAINVEEANADYCSVDGVLFTKDKKALVTFPIHKGASVENYVYTVPEGTETIGYSAFELCESMSELTLPASLTSIEDYAFSFANIGTLTCKATTPPTATIESFGGLYSYILPRPLFVPFASIGAYKTAPGWEKFEQILSPELYVELGEATNIHAKSADMSWKGAGESYDLRYKDYYSLDDWTVVEGITETSYHMTDLKDDRYYQVEVRSKYSGEYGEWYGTGYYNFQTPKLYMLVYKVDGEVYATEYHEAGETIVLLPDPPAKEGYTFSGWQYPVDEMPNYDYAIVGYYEIATYQVTLEAEHGTIDVLPLYLDLDKIEHGTILELTAKANEAYKFIGWSDGVETESRDLTVVSDTTVTALFELIPDFYDPKNLKVTQTPIGNDVEIAFTWDKVDQAASYQVQLEYDEQVYGPIPTLGDNSLTVNLSFVRSKITIPVAPGSYTIKWAVRSVDILNSPLCDWVESEFVIVVEDTGTGLDSQKSKVESRKLLIDGQLFIIVGEKMYDAAGRLVK